MQIQWKGHSSFLLTSKKGTKILTDPYDESVGYPVPRVGANVVTVSHQHHDHNATGLLPGVPVVVDDPGTHIVAGVEICGVPTFHDQEQGAKRGKNIVYVIALDGINVCHLGDIGHALSPEQIEKIGQVDVLCIPVGGNYTVDAQQAKEIVEQLKPTFVLPMHYKYEGLVKYPIAAVDEFIKLFPSVKRLPKLEVDAESLPKDQQVIVLELS